MTSPSHHPSEILLMDYATGSLCEAKSLVIGTHLALCRRCRNLVGQFEAVGGSLLEMLEPDLLSPGALKSVLDRLGRSDRPKLARRRGIPQGVPLFPQPLRSYLGEDPALLRWRSIVPGMQGVKITLSRGGTARLVRTKGGFKLPHHSHEGLELALVLQGGFSDEAGHFVRGDVEICDDTVDHRPIADPEGCLFLAVNTGPLRLTGPVGRILNGVLQMIARCSDGGARRIGRSHMCLRRH